MRFETFFRRHVSLHTVMAYLYASDRAFRAALRSAQLWDCCNSILTLVTTAIVNSPFPAIDVSLGKLSFGGCAEVSICMQLAAIVPSAGMHLKDGHVFFPSLVTFATVRGVLRPREVLSQHRRAS
jgi:hypothetical protein